MAKCTLCNSAKGKRKCQADATFICSLCCGKSRSFIKCDGCSFYKDPLSQRNYRKVPFYDIHEMSASLELDKISTVIESTLCRLEQESETFFSDKNASRHIELYFDKFYFKDTELVFSDAAQKDQFQLFLQKIEEALPEIPGKKLVKVMAAIYRSIQRRTQGGREYLLFVRQLVG